MKAKTKIVLSFIFMIIMTSITIINSYAITKSHWYIKHNKGKIPTFPADAESLEEYNVYYIDKKCEKAGEKKIYLTFDAGYENGNVERILDALKAESVPAAFFVLDNIIIKNTDIVTRMAEEGHLVCNHTKNHKDLSCATKEEIDRNLKALETIYKEKTGKEMSKYFRFPEGNYSLDAIKHINNLGYKTIFWSFAYDDWDNSRQQNKDKAIKKIIDNTHNGEVILLHPTSSTNAEILPTLICEWRKMGYSFGSLDELTLK